MIARLKIYIFIVFILSGCSGEISLYNATQVPQDKREKIESAEFSSDLFVLSEYIELDLDYKLWPFYDIIVGDKYIIGIIRAGNMRAYAWHRSSGRFLGEMTPYGKGPGEAINTSSAVFIDDSTALLFDMGLSRATIFRLSPDGFFFDDVIDTAIWSSGTIHYAWKNEGRIYLFNQSGGTIDTYRIIILDKALDPIKKCLPRKHNSFAMFESYVISGDRIFMTDELYHKNVKDIKEELWQVEGRGKLLVSDLEGDLVGRIELPFEELLVDIIPDSKNETFYIQQLGENAYIMDTAGEILKMFDEGWPSEKYPWLKTSLQTSVRRGKKIYVDRGKEGKLILRIFEYDV